MRRARKLIIPMLISIPCLFLFAQCHIGAIAPILTGKKIWLSDKPQLVEQEILRQVSIGSSIETARDVMEQNGFECRYYKNETYYYRGTGAESRDIDFYACGLNKPWFFLTKTWSVQLETKQGKLTRVSASYGYVTL
ncbi:hypothetical protein C7B82_23955 [Stenomitos frigidus ULC18]|uniref:Uncharacterized protein n=2 Tax=Stenomitos TaxID=1844270 RepID=A0A2T1DXR6_9CYAN|nr:hypothetical protein C7B82_23955 [Stenomitos frigidus ULC18]